MSAEAAIERLFTRHLVELDARRLVDYLAFNRLPADLAWEDAQGRRWTLLDRLAEHVLAHAPTQDNADALAHLIRVKVNADAMAHLLPARVNADVLPWHKAPSPVRSRRARLLLAAFRAAHADPGAAAIRHLAPWFKTSFAGKPEGTPAAGFGQDEDGGWLAPMLAHLDALRQELPPGQRDFSTEATAWLADSLWARSDRPSGRWWDIGGVSGTRVRQRFAGRPGWELPGSLPFQPPALGMSDPVRPRALPAHFSRLAARLLSLVADGLADARRFDAGASLGLPPRPDPRDLAAFTPQMHAALLEVAQAGLLHRPAGPHPHQRYDGRALDALEWLLATDPDLGMASQDQRLQLAQAVRDHQAALEQSGQPHARALAQSSLAPAARAGVWAWSQAPSPRPSSTTRLARP